VISVEALSALALLMPGVGAQDAHDALALDDLALGADGLDRRANFHDALPCSFLRFVLA
jgi:hypothetical protein